MKPSVQTPSRRRPSLPRPQTISVGIDLAGVSHRETGLALIRDGRLERVETAGDDAEILHFVAEAGLSAVVAINAPLTRPLGRCCLDDDCPCRTDPGTRSRRLERELARMGVPTLATALIKVLARRGARIAGLLRDAGWSPIEVYPFATLKLLGLPYSGKKTDAGRRRIERGLRGLVDGLRHPRATNHEIDAVICALTAELSRIGMTREVGDPVEGLMIVPSRDLACPTPDLLLASESPGSTRPDVAGTGGEPWTKTNAPTGSSVTSTIPPSKRSPTRSRRASAADPPKPNSPKNGSPKTRRPASSSSTDRS